MPAKATEPRASEGSSIKQGKRRRQEDADEESGSVTEREVNLDEDEEVQEQDVVLLDGEDEALSEAESSKAAASSSKSGKKKRKPVPGVIYISRVPPGMTPQKIKYLMGRWGDVGKLYAQKRGAPTSTASGHGNKKQKHAQALYSEAWVQFLDKNVAKTVAEMLNAEIIGGKKGDRYRDDIWTMKYLSGFKWEMLGEQVAYERQAHTARLRNEVSQSRAEQSEYLKNVELARVLDKRKARKEATGAPTTTPNAGGTEDRAKGERSYRQREPAKAKGEGMDGLMSSVFG